MADGRRILTRPATGQFIRIYDPDTDTVFTSVIEPFSGVITASAQAVLLKDGRFYFSPTIGQGGRVYGSPVQCPIPDGRLFNAHNS